MTVVEDPAAPLVEGVAQFYNLPEELLLEVLGHLPAEASVAVALGGVCSQWRKAIGQETSYLKRVEFRLDKMQPFKGLDNSKRAPGMPHKRALAGPPPQVLQLAAKAGNVSALVTHATMLELQGRQEAAVRAWKKAAQAGSAYSMFKMGEAFYRGYGDCGIDGEESLFWLNRALKQRDQLSKDTLSTAACIMGFLHADGEGTAACNEAAVKWFRLAAENGNIEASTTLGWMYNTGQY